MRVGTSTLDLRRAASVDDALRLMRDEGWITPGEEAQALREPPELSPPPGGEGDFGYVLDMAQAQARELTKTAGAPDLIVRLEIDRSAPGAPPFDDVVVGAPRPGRLAVEVRRRAAQLSLVARAA